MFAKFVLAALLLLTTACATKTKTVRRAPKPPTVTEDGTPYVTEINFDKTKSVLRYNEQKRIDDALDTASIEAEPGRVIVIAWTDQQVPTRTKEEIQLAHDRGWIVKKIIQEKNASIPVEVVNLATQPQRLEELMDSSETKKALQVFGVEDKSSKTIMMVIPKKRQ